MLKGLYLTTQRIIQTWKMSLANWSLTLLQLTKFQNSQAVIHKNDAEKIQENGHPAVGYPVGVVGSGSEQKGGQQQAAGGEEVEEVSH